MSIEPQIVEIAREVYGDSENPEHIRSRLYIELHKTVKRDRIERLKWNEINLTEKLIKIGWWDFEVGFKEQDGLYRPPKRKWVESERYEIDDATVALFELWLICVNNLASEAGLTLPEYVFCDTYTSELRYKKGEFVIRKLSNNDFKGIVQRCRDELMLRIREEAQAKAEEHEIALQIQFPRLVEIEFELAELEAQKKKLHIEKDAILHPERYKYSGDGIECLDLSVRTYNSLKRSGISTVDELLEALAAGPDRLLAIRNFGTKALDETVNRLQSRGLLVEYP